MNEPIKSKSSFALATKKKTRARVCLVGPSGSGKTKTGLKLLKGLGCTRIAVIDTEAGSASKYAGDDGIDFDTAQLHSFEPANYIALMREILRGGYDGMLCDSLSHAWMGKGGIMDQKDRDRSAGFDAWRKLTPQHNNLIDAIVRMPIHAVYTMRSKTEYVVESVDGKMKPRKIGTAPVQRDGMEYEFDVVGELDMANMLHISKTRCASLSGGDFTRDETYEVGERLAAWLDDGVDAPPPERMPAAPEPGTGEEFEPAKQPVPAPVAPAPVPPAAAPVPTPLVAVAPAAPVPAPAVSEALAALQAADPVAVAATATVIKKPGGAEATRTLVALMNAVDSCHEDEDIEKVALSWAPAIAGLPTKGRDNAESYIAVRRADLLDEKPKEEDVRRAGLLAVLRPKPKAAQ